MGPMRNGYEDIRYAGSGAELKEQLLRLEAEFRDTCEPYPDLIENHHKHW